MAPANTRGVCLGGYRDGADEKALSARRGPFISEAKGLRGILEPMVRTSLSYRAMTDALAGVGNLSKVFDAATQALMEQGDAGVLKHGSHVTAWSVPRCCSGAQAPYMYGIIGKLINFRRGKMTDFLERIKKTPKGIKGIAKSALNKVQPLSEKASAITSIGIGAIGASLSRFNDIPFDASQVTRIKSAMANHGISAADAVKALPDELTKFGTDVVEQFLKNGDSQGKHWSHIESQKTNPELAADPNNAIWEDGTTNISRNSRDMTVAERVTASFDNHFDAFLTTVRTQEFWQRTLGNAFEASAYAAAITALDMFLVRRDELINGTNERKQEILMNILKQSGLMAAGALPVSVFLAVLLLMVPGLSLAMGPLGLLGSVGLSLRLVTSLVKNPSQQEKEFLASIQGYMQGLIYDFKRDKDGSLTIDVVALPAS